MSTIELSNLIITDMINSRYKQVTTDFFVTNQKYSINIDAGIFDTLYSMVSEVGQNI